jgi:hypothetical protein
MKKWLINIIFQIVSLPAILQATRMVNLDSSSDVDILQALLSALASSKLEITGELFFFILCN